MQKLIAALIICQAFILFQCADEMTPTNSTDSMDEFAIGKILEVEKDMQLAKGEGGGSRFCCNSNFPEYNKVNPGSENCATFALCEGYRDENISCVDCALLWSVNAHIEGEDLLFQACEGESNPSLPAAPEWADGSIVGDNPHIEWGFVYSHKYEVQRKRGNGSWGTLTTLNNCMSDEQSCNDSTYTDAAIDLDTITVNYHYRIRTIVYTLTSTPSEAVTFTAPLSVNISGPSSITSSQTGTFIANVQGGVSPFTYEWWKKQECDLERSGGLRAPPCGSWVKLGETSNTLVIGGDEPGIYVRVGVTDDEEDENWDTHHCWVTAP